MQTSESSAFADTEPMGEASVAPEPEHFHLEQRRALWLLLVLLAIIGLLAMLVFAIAVKDGRASAALVSGLVVALLAWGSWRVLRAATDRRPLLSLDGQGLRYRSWKRVLPWPVVEDVQVMQLQGQKILVLKLDPASGVPAGWKRKSTTLNLRSFQPATQVQILQAIQRRLTHDRARRGAGELPSAVQAREAAAFEAELKRRTPVTWALYGVMALNIGVWLCQVFMGIDAFRPLAGDLFRWGANSTHAVTQDGQWWRLATATVLHGGLMHLALNMLGLWEAGRQVSRLYGNLQFLLIYGASALAGSALSLHFSSARAVSVGASGAVFGVLGAVLVAVLRSRQRIPALMGQQMLVSQGIFVLYALAQGFGNRGVDNAAHIGGLVAGALCAAILPQVLSPASPAARLARTVPALGSVAVAVVALVWLAPSDAINHRGLFALQARLPGLLKEFEGAARAVAADANAARAQPQAEAEFIRRVRVDHVPTFTRLEGELATIDAKLLGARASGFEDLRLQVRLMREILMIQLRISDDPTLAAELGARMSQLTREVTAAQARMRQSLSPTNAPKP